eukprot:s4881_g2.t1
MWHWHLTTDGLGKAMGSRDDYVKASRKPPARPEIRPEQRKQSREAGTSASSSRNRRTRTSASSRSREARASSSSSRSRRARTSSSSSRSRSPKAKQKASSSGPSGPPFRRSPPPGKLWGFDVGKYGQNMKGATVNFFSRLLHSGPGDPGFGTYEILKDADGKFQCTLRLAEGARTAARLRRREYKGGVCRTKAEAEQSAARAFWDDSLVKERAAKLEPSKKDRRNRKRFAEAKAASAKRKALYGYGTGVERIITEDRKGSRPRHPGRRDAVDDVVALLGDQGKLSTRCKLRQMQIRPRTAEDNSEEASHVFKGQTRKNGMGES